MTRRGVVLALSVAAIGLGSGCGGAAPTERDALGQVRGRCAELGVGS